MTCTPHCEVQKHEFSDLTCGFLQANSVLRTKITSLYGFQTSPVVLTRKTATLGPELQVSIGPRPHLWICACKTGLITRSSLLYGAQNSSVDLCKQNSVPTTKIASLYGSLTSPVHLCMQNSVLSTKLTSLYWSQPMHTQLKGGAMKKQKRRGTLKECLLRNHMHKNMNKQLMGGQLASKNAGRR